MARLDLLMTTGDRRPIWGRSGPLSPREWVLAIQWREWVIDGYHSIASGRDRAATTAPPAPSIGRQLAQMPPIPQPPAHYLARDV